MITSTESAWTRNRTKASILVLTYEDMDMLWDLVTGLKTREEIPTIANIAEACHDALAETDARGF